jgi:voltage-gated potassium channel
MVHVPHPIKRSLLRRRLAAFINHPVTDLVVMVLIVASVGLLVWEASVEPETTLYTDLVFINLCITGIFVVELTLRFLAERHKARFFRRYWLDILAVLPIFRPFRFLRFLRLLRVFRLGVLLHRRFTAISAAFRRGFGEQVLVAGFILVIVLASAMVLTITEKRTEQRRAAAPATPVATAGEATPGGETATADPTEQDGPFVNFWQSLRWSVLSLVAGEPVGEMPRTAYGFMVTLAIMLGGLTLFATFTGVITAIVVNRLRGGLEQFEMDVEELSDHTIICGYNRACRLIVEELQTDPQIRRRGIVVITEQDVRPSFEGAGVDLSRVHFLRGDWTHSDHLTRAGAERAAIAVVLADRTRDLSDQDRDARTLLAALTLERINPRIFTCAELLNSQNEANLKLAGIDEVIARDKYTGSMIAAGARNLGIVGVLKELLTSKWGNQFYKVEVPEDWVGRTVAEVRPELHERHHAILIAVETPVAGRHGGQTTVNPPSDTVLSAGQLIVLIAHHQPRIGGGVVHSLWAAPESGRPAPPAGPAPE